MRTLSTDEAREVLSLYPFLRLHMIPPEGIYLSLENIWMLSNDEGEVTLVKIEE
jgi:hypothetical protein